MRDNSGVVDEQGEPVARVRRGRPRKWPSETARRQHEAAKRRLRNKTHLTPGEFDDVVRLTVLADDLQRRLDGAIRELGELRWHAQELERRLTEAAQPGRPTQQSTAAWPASRPRQNMNRQQRREAERVQRRRDSQQRRSVPPP
jgi:hypothetical protein